MKKPTKSYLIKKLDIAFAKHIKRAGVCQRCGKAEHLNCAHAYSRAKMSIRWYDDNAFCMCVGCHFFWAHRNPLEFASWVQKTLGDERFAALILKSNKHKKWSIEEMQERLKELESLNSCQ